MTGRVGDSEEGRPLTQPKITKDALRAMAAASGLELSDEQLDELLPQVLRSVDGLDDLDVLDLQDVEPAVLFKTDQE